ncbi:MAG: DUF5723 family protein [Bacteroidales bacterium]|nr:DUF5723 family protein [Bacteroidales bacterium]MDD4702873.1 DUF5723 family protein [Bacteroidales bacterium]
MKKILLTIVFLYLFLLSNNSIKAQYSDISYFMRNTPFSYKMNPAQIPTSTFYINLPILSGINIDFKTSGFSYNDLIKRRDDDSLYFDFKGLYNSLSNSNYIKMNGNFELFGFGFNAGKKNYISFGVDLNFDTRLRFSRDLFGVLSGDKTFSNESISVIDNDILSLNSYVSTYLGYTRAVNDKLNVGLRAKFILGLANITTEESKLQITQNDQGITAQSNFLIRSSSLIGSLKLPGLNSSDSIEFDINSDSIMANIMKNKGFGIDLGGTYKLNDKMILSLSIQDLGFIKWAANTTDIVSKNPNGTYTFTGFQNISSDSSFSQQSDQIVDSLTQAFDITTRRGETYTTMLPTKVYVGYDWNFSKRHHLNMLYKASFGSNYFDNYLSVFYALQLERYLNLSVGNTFAFENSFNNIKAFNPSIALNFNLLILNIYFGGSLNSSYNAAKMTGLNLFFGINSGFGYNNPFKVNKEEPKAENETQIPEKEIEV